MSAATMERVKKVAEPEPAPVAQWWDDVEVGDIVHHWNGDEKPVKPVSAVVVAVRAGGKVSLSLIVENRPSLTVSDKSNVPHCREPRLKERLHLSRYGCWELPPAEAARRKRLAELEAMVATFESLAAMRSEIASLRGKVTYLQNQVKGSTTAD